MKEGTKLIVRKEFEAPQQQAEKLLPAIEKILISNKLKLSDIKEIEVEAAGEGFSSLRIGVTTANTLAYALSTLLSIPGKGRVTLAAPKYSREPSITQKK